MASIEKNEKNVDNASNDIQNDGGLTEPQKATNDETWKHIDLVMRLLASAQIELMRRQFTHDRSKLRHPEVATFAEVTSKLAALTYGSDEYKQMLAAMKPALDHHYSHNRHHPEFFEKREKDANINGHILMAKMAIRSCNVPSDGENILSSEEASKYEKLRDFLYVKQDEHQSSINNMNLFDILEMLIDWYAATKRHDDGDIYKSIEINQKRFGLSDQLVQVFLNTLPWIEDKFSELKTQKDL